MLPELAHQIIFTRMSIFVVGRSVKQKIDDDAALEGGC